MILYVLLLICTAVWLWSIRKLFHVYHLGPEITFKMEYKGTSRGAYSVYLMLMWIGVFALPAADVALLLMIVRS